MYKKLQFIFGQNISLDMPDRIMYFYLDSVQCTSLKFKFELHTIEIPIVIAHHGPADHARVPFLPWLAAFPRPIFDQSLLMDVTIRFE